MSNKPKKLFLDIETAPRVAYVWSFFKANISPKQVLEHGRILSYSAVWDDEDRIINSYNHDEDDTPIVCELIKLLDSADIVIGHNLDKFDRGVINGQAAIAGIHPPSPYKVVDTYKVAKKEFNFPSNSLEYLSNVFNLNYKKKDHAKYPGWSLWIECLKGNKEAINEMMEYNDHDTLAVRELYYKMLPYIRNHPNVGVYMESDKPVCPACGSHHIHYRGYTNTNVGKYRKYQCQECGHWSRTRKTEYPKEKASSLLVNAN